MKILKSTNLKSSIYKLFKSKTTSWPRFHLENKVVKNAWRFKFLILLKYRVLFTKLLCLHDAVFHRVERLYAENLSCRELKRGTIKRKRWNLSWAESPTESTKFVVWVWFNSKRFGQMPVSAHTKKHWR